MLSAFGRVIKTADLRRKLLFTLGMIVLYRMGTFIPAPGISYGTVQQCIANNSSVLTPTKLTVAPTTSSTCSAVVHSYSFLSSRWA